jgi:hypothetical protein
MDQSLPVALESKGKAEELKAKYLELKQAK